MRFDETLSLREARQRHFDANGFSVAQYSHPWVKLQFGPVPCWLPNTRSRQRAVPLHDLHHVLTGYGTSWSGEAEISAWELATGCRDYGAAWILNGLGLLMGLLIAPRRTVRAFLRGRRTLNLYGRDVNEALLERRVGDLRKELRLSP